MSTIEGQTPMPTQPTKESLSSIPSKPAVPVEKSIPPEEKQKPDDKSLDTAKSKKVESGVAVFQGKGSPEVSERNMFNNTQTLRQELDALAAKKYGKSSYGELPIDARLATLCALKDIPASTREVIAELQGILASPPEHGQLDQIKKVLVRLPQEKDFSCLGAEIQRKVAEGLMSHVSVHREDYKLDQAGLSRFAGEIGDVSVGQVIQPFGFHEIANDIVDPDLKQFLLDEQPGYEMRGYNLFDRDDIESEIRLLDGVRTDIINGANPKNARYDSNDAQKAVKRINARITELKGQKIFVEQTIRKSGDLENFSSKDANDLMERIEDESSLRYIKPRDVKKAYEKISGGDEQRERFKLLIKKQIREKLAILEESDEPWELRQSLDPTIQELNQWFLIIHEIDYHAHENIRVEADVRQWLHNLYLTMKKGPSPTETKELLHRMQDYDAMKLYKSLLHIPGVAEAFRLWEANSIKLIEAEKDPIGREKIINKIVEQLEIQGVCKTEETGISVRTAVKLAERHFKESGRDAMKYREYIRKNNLIEIRNENGVLRYYVDPHTPLLWDPYRLLYCPEAMWAFFEFGANMEGAKIKMKINGKDREMIAAQGLGPDIVKLLKENGFDLQLTDFYSRRRGYIKDAWVDGVLAQNETLSGNNKEDSDIWYGVYGKTNTKEKELNEMLQKCLGFTYEGKFAKKNGVAMWSSFEKDELERLDKKIALMIKKHPNRESLIKRVYGEFNDTLKEKKAWNAQKEHETDGGFFMDISRFKFENVQWDRMKRQHEVVRGNFRDHFAGLQVFSQIGDFINNPSFENFSKLDPNAMKAYTTLIDAQRRFMIPAYLAFCDVQQGKGLFGDEMTGLVDTFKSKYGKVYDVKSLTDLDLYKIGRMLVTQGKLTRDELYVIRGQFGGLLRDKTLENADPLSLMVLFMALAKEISEQIKKDLEKS